MCVYGGVSRRAGQVLTITVGDVLARLRVTESLGQAEVNHVHVVLFLANANEEVVWFDVAVQEMTRVDELYALQL